MRFSLRRQKIGTDGRPVPKRRKAAKPGPSAPTYLGWDLPGGGLATTVDNPPEWRGPSTQVAGLYPWSCGSSLPMIGAPLGVHLHGRGVVCGDPVSWFAAGLINNPSGFVLARPGLGKSSLVERVLSMLHLRGLIPMVLSDYKGEYVELIRALGGQVVRPQRGSQYVNPLDRGPLWMLLSTMPEDKRAAALADIEARRINVLCGLCELALGREMDPHERNLLVRCLDLWDELHPHETPVIPDLLDMVQTMPDVLGDTVHYRGSHERYFARVEGVLDALVSLAGSGEFGDVFARQTSVTFQMHKPLCFDLSWVEAQDKRLQAGLQLVLWSYGSGAVAAAKFLADADPTVTRRTYVLVMDELWRSLKAAPFMVNRIDEITRLNRTLALAQILITHTMDDLRLHSDEATATAFGFVARSEMVFMGGLAPSEMGNLSSVFAMSRREQQMLESWSPPGHINPATGQVDPPPGRGKFILKVGQQTGTPFQVILTQLEREIHDTNASWRDTFDSINATHRQDEVAAA